MNAKRMMAIGSCVALLAAAGCKKTADNKINYTSAINTYYSSRPACLWTDSVKFPVQADTSDTTKTQGYDALVDQGLLMRTTAEKKVFIVASKQVTNYDISDKGRGSWTPDTQEPGAGNFCYGKPSVKSIDSSTPTTDKPGATTTVGYTYEVSGAPGWATAAETQTAFPGVAAQLSGPKTASATLTNTTSGWAVTSGPGRATRPASSADGKVVE
ncbi:hypothetical protein [Granulicella tundricola]|uniref:Lipoprotein n=1 Tax=Granulicella tundricola (strain ATCC BAA-1859 / DSM 23138 / MP5ACTX9) TaxID=1198114 RepID=E8WW65_GRATM|nr:hypothetical protein [Granulicella tundricola]ADW67371.1 hypothetical protein AciX9_0299 [Granulicella tundricola MP5ACTX9]